MIELTPGKQLIASSLNSSLSEIGWNSYRVDRDLVEADLMKLQKLSETVEKRSKTAVNIVSTVRHLWKLNKYLTGDRYSYKLELQNNDGAMIATTPFQMVKIPEFKVQTTDYIILEGTSLVELNFSKALDTIAFEMCHHDVGITWEEAEESLKQYSLLTRTPAENVDVLKYIRYEQSKGFRILRSTCGSTDEMKTYFGDAVSTRGNQGVYYKPLMATARKAGCFITQYVIDTLKRAGAEGWQVVAVFEDSVQLLVEDKHLNEVVEPLKNVEIVTKVHSRSIVTPLDIVK